MKILSESSSHGSKAGAVRIEVEAADGYRLRGYLWRRGNYAAEGATDVRPIVIVNSATSVACRYYARFADYLFANGLDVVTYDYRGIGVSRHGSLRRFDASWIDWGALDFEAVLRSVLTHFPGRPVSVAAHSFGGCAVGLAASASRLERVFTVGAQFAYWRDYAASHRFRMLLRWHVVMPLIGTLFGYFPGKRLGWLEDTPLGVVRDWATPHPRLEGRPAGRRLLARGGRLSFESVTARTLAVSITDDPFGTIAAETRLLEYFASSDRAVVEISPAAVGVDDIGHFGFFNSRFEATLWPVALSWLKHGALHASVEDRVAWRKAAAD